MTVASLLLTLLVISIMVMVHEFGHFFFARLFGVTVHEFSVGFGPLITSWKKNGIQYSLRAVPLGGFVKIAGMDIALEGEAGKEEGERLFGELPLLRKILVIVAGPLNNLILAMLTFMFMAGVIGIPYQQQTERAIIGVVEPKSPAYEAGLSPGDEIVEIDGQPINSWKQIAEVVHKSPRKTLTFKVRRDNTYFTREIRPFYDPAYEVGRIGILPSYTIKRLPFADSLKFGVLRTWYGIQDIPVSLFRMLIGKERAGVMGPLGMVGAIDQALQSGLHLFFSIVAGINLFLGLFNLLPIPLPLLDGGWIVILILERLRRKEFTPEQKTAAQMVGLAAILLLTVIATYTDILSILRRMIK